MRNCKFFLQKMEKEKAFSCKKMQMHFAPHWEDLVFGLKNTTNTPWVLQTSAYIILQSITLHSLYFLVFDPRL